MVTLLSNKVNNICPCKSGKTYLECCKPIILDGKKVRSAEELMRSRYSAYVTGEIEYLLDSTCEIVDPINIKLETETFSSSAFFQHLEILDVQEYIVEFKAYFIVEKKQEVLHEKSNFLHKNDGSWCYKDGYILPSEFNPKRNEKCICGSGKKYKQCCAKLL